MIDRAVFDSHLVTYLPGGHCDLWSINPYKHCDFHCSYCITGAQGTSAPTFARESTLEIIRQSLKEIPHKLPVLVGGISDAYAYAEQEHKLTREILKILNAQNRTYTVVTKSTLIERDIDLLLQNPCASVSLSFSTMDDKLAKLFELKAPAPSARLKTLEKLLECGIDVRLSLSPWIPTVTNVQAFLDRVPAIVPINLERLKVIRSSRSFPVLGRVFRQSEIDTLYLLEQKKYSGYKQLSWMMDERFQQTEADIQHPRDIIVKNTDAVFQQLVHRGSH